MWREVRIANRRITVEDITVWRERLGLSADQIAAEYGQSLPEIYAALAYYIAHREAIEASMKEGQTLAETVRRANPSLAKQRLHGD
jgi:uncharacterized protein (DUF433 family)